MKLVEARNIANRQLDVLNVRRQQIRKMIKEEEKSGGGVFDRVELSKELEVLDKAYDQTFQERERINMVGVNIQNAEISKQQAEAQAEANEEMMKCLEIFRRIAKGDKVPPQDEEKLMEFDSKMYMAAKNMALMHVSEKHEKHDSLWEDEEEKEESPDPQELADNAEVELSLPQIDVGRASEAES